nr:MAG TPA_asm: hypothetical protein [Caudoviricetes sp.]
MVTRKDLDKMSAFKVLILAFLKLYLAACTSTLIMGIILGLLNIILPFIY